MGEEPNHTTARKPGPLSIIQKSLGGGFQSQILKQYLYAGEFTCFAFVPANGTWETVSRKDVEPKSYKNDSPSLEDYKLLFPNRAEKQQNFVRFMLFFRLPYL